METNKNNTICLNMIVKNESKIIKRCLESVYDIIDTWCIIDTGSTDGTQEIIKEFLKDKPGILHEKKWVNFGHNRDEALKLGSSWGDWLITTDADMVLVNTGFTKDQLSLDIDVYDLMQDNNGTCYNNMRILNTKKVWNCLGVTHEYYDCEGGVNSRVFLNTLHFNDISDGGSKDNKFTRDIALLTQGLIDNPENCRYMFYLAQSYRDTNDWENAIKWYQARWDFGGWEEEQWFALYMVGYCMLKRKDPEKDSFDNIAAVMFKAWNARPWRSEPIWSLAIEARMQEKWHNAYQYSKIAATTSWPKHDVLFINKAAYGLSALDEFGISSYYVGEFKESEQALLKLLNTPGLPENEVPRLQKNLWYARKNLGLYDENGLLNYIEQKRKEI